MLGPLLLSFRGSGATGALRAWPCCWDVVIDVAADAKKLRDEEPLGTIVILFVLGTLSLAIPLGINTACGGHSLTFSLFKLRELGSASVQSWSAKFVEGAERQMVHLPRPFFLH